jgi:hypothetical protein
MTWAMLKFLILFGKWAFDLKRGWNFYCQVCPRSPVIGQCP